MLFVQNRDVKLALQTRSLALLVALSVAATSSVVASAEGANVIVFENVRVLTMTEHGALDNATVVIRGGSISSVGGSVGDIPDGAVLIDGSGKTLMPGLADMHVHYWSNSQGPLYLANSVTTVRNPWGSSQNFVLDARSKDGIDVSPHVYSSGPLMDGPEPIWGEGSLQLTSPEQAVGAVESQRTTGYGAVKLYEGLTPDIYRAAVKAAKDRDMQVWTHVPGGMTVEDVIALGVDSIEHFDDVEDSLYAGDDGGDYFARWAGADPGRMDELAKASADAGVWHSPTFAVIANRYEYGADADGFFRRPEAAYIGSGLQDWWRGSASRMGPFDDTKRAAAANQKRFLKALYDASAPLLIGTDTPNPFVVPGFAIHDELAAFIDAGIPVADVLRIATADAATFLREGGEWGVVAADARADLVLLDADPHDDLSTLRRPLGVMVNGHWRDAKAIASELDDMRNAITAEAAGKD